MLCHIGRSIQCKVDLQIITAREPSMTQQEIHDILALVSSPQDREKIFDYAKVALDPLRTHHKTSLVTVFKGQEFGASLVWYGPESSLEKNLLRLLDGGTLKRSSRLLGIKYYDGSRWDICFRKRRGGGDYISASPAKPMPRSGPPPAFTFLK